MSAFKRIGLRLLGVGAGGVLTLLLTATGVGVSLQAPGYTGPVSDHFDGTQFFNVEPIELPSMSKGWRFLLTRNPGRWEPRSIEVETVTPVQRVSEGLKATFVNHATVLLQMDGVNVLTDPIWADRASPFTWFGPRRYHQPGVTLSDLPPVDLILLSHNHYDHTDVATLAKIAERDDPLVIAGLGNAGLLAQNGVERVQEMDWGDRFEFKGLEVIGQRSRHFSTRGFGDRQKSLWISFVVRGPSSSVYFAGDTGYGSHFKETGDAFGPVDLALLPIGAYAPRWFMKTLHMNPAESVQAHVDLRARRSMGIHFGTFRLTEEAQDAPAEELSRAREAAGLEEEVFIAPIPGQEVWGSVQDAARVPGDAPP